MTGDDDAILAANVAEIADAKLGRAVEHLREARRGFRSAALRLSGDRVACRSIMTLADEVDALLVRGTAVRRRQASRRGLG